MFSFAKSIKKYQHGFTLIEVMLVLVLMGLIVSGIRFAVVTKEPQDILEETSQRFVALFGVAAEYGLLNNIELGVVIEKNSYMFVGFDGTNWQAIDQEQLAKQELPDGVVTQLSLDDLPVDDDAFIDTESLFSSEDEIQGNAFEEEKKIIPQILLLSGGDLSPFKLTFAFSENAIFEQEIEFEVIGLFTLPLTIKGPIVDGQMPNE